MINLRIDVSAHRYSPLDSRDPNNAQNDRAGQQPTWDHPQGVNNPGEG